MVDCVDAARLIAWLLNVAAACRPRPCFVYTILRKDGSVDWFVDHANSFWSLRDFGMKLPSSPDDFGRDYPNSAPVRRFAPTWPPRRPMSLIGCQGRKSFVRKTLRPTKSNQERSGDRRTHRHERDGFALRDVALAFETAPRAA